MCGGSDVKCEVKVTELENGYQIQVTGDNVKDALKSENLKKCMDPVVLVKPHLMNRAVVDGASPLTVRI